MLETQGTYNRGPDHLRNLSVTALAGAVQGLPAGLAGQGGTFNVVVTVIYRSDRPGGGPHCAGAGIRRRQRRGLARHQP